MVASLGGPGLRGPILFATAVILVAGGAALVLA
jgi:hypothetical protein